MWNIRKIVSKGDYYYAVVPEHPRRTKNNYVLLHRVLMENHLGQLLDSDAVIHHINGHKKDNRISNLQIMTASQHASIHAKEKGETMCELKCPQCKRNFIRRKRQTHLIKTKNKCTCCSLSCRGKFWRDVQLDRLTTRQVESAVSENILRELNSLDDAEGTHLQETP